MLSADVSSNTRIAISAGEAANLGAGILTVAEGDMSSMVQRYSALPIHHAMPHPAASPPAHHALYKSENTLRRKTPNGTLNAGYDGSAEGFAPPVKHQLLPLSEGNAALPDPLTIGPKRTFVEHARHMMQSSSGREAKRPAFGKPPADLRWYGAPTSPSQSASILPVVDSSPHHMSIQRPNAPVYYSQSVPSVVQPSLQHLGPTASGGQGLGPYGPYWHDGTYVPYRPAAVRDPRYRQPPHEPTTTQRRPVAMDHGNAWSRAGQHAPWIYPGGSQYQLSPLHASRPARLPLPVEPLPAGPEATTYVPQPQSSRLSVNSEHGRRTSTFGEYMVTGEFVSSSPSGLYRDQVFAWALQQYKELLAFIHHTKRQQQQRVRHGAGLSSEAHRTNFYPRPPQAPISGSPSTLSKSDSASIAAEGGRREYGPCSPSSTPPGHLDTRNRDPLISRPTEQAAHRVDHDQGHHRHTRRESYELYRRNMHASSLLTRRHDEFACNRQFPSQGQGYFPASERDFPPSKAATALESIANLCQVSDWQWIDGMHLGGCLAYGLGDYQKAHAWFSRVLEKDSKHLEASSNLAAASLALGRRQEAEQHWMKVVRVAPTYFEAVEHLVGLLCNDQRSKDAIRVIEYVERSLRLSTATTSLKGNDHRSECSSSTASRSPCVSETSDKVIFDFDSDGDGFHMDWRDSSVSSQPGFGSSGYAIPGRENGRILALIHAKGNMLYSLGDNSGAARAFEDAVLIATGRGFDGIQALVQHILTVVSATLVPTPPRPGSRAPLSPEPMLLTPEQALLIAKLCFQPQGELPGLSFIGPNSLARKAVIATTSNSLLSLAKIFQDGMSNPSRSAGVRPLAHGVRDVLALYYLSLALQPSPSTANNVGILLASVQQATVPATVTQRSDIPGVVPGSGTALALSYYNYGLHLDKHHAHLYTNLGSLLKDIGQLDAAINMYERAVHCDGKFDIALANLANAVKDKGRISDAIVYYKRAVEVSPDFAEAVCGLANALNSVCAWQGRGGISDEHGRRDRWHVDDNNMLLDAKLPGACSSGWIKRVVDIVERQLSDGESWGVGSTTSAWIEAFVSQIIALECPSEDGKERERNLRKTLRSWSGHKWEGARLTRLVERATKRILWHSYRDKYVKHTPRSTDLYNRPHLPGALTVPAVPTVLPFHTFTCPMSAKQVRLISQRNGLRISVATLRAPWISRQMYMPPPPPSMSLRVGYVSSDFNNHPLAHLMQSVFGLHDRRRVEAYCYATTASDNSVHRQQIQDEAPHFYDASAWSAERLIDQIIKDGIHILVNLNGYTRGARNEVFAARPVPIQMSFMGFASTLGAEWCDYLLADETAVPVDTLRPWRRNVDLEDQFVDENSGGDQDEWVYGENIIYCRDTFFCCDHRQSAPDAQAPRLSWAEEQEKRWLMRKELFPQISDDTVIFGNFNQLYKIEPTTFRSWLRILARVPNSILWLLRFPDLGESHLLATARLWAGADVASRIMFTDVAPKHLHISRARVCDLVLDTAECNAHTTAADVLWSGTPLLTLPRYGYKMCSRMAASILKGALPKDEEGDRAAGELIATSEEDYEEKAVALGKAISYEAGGRGLSQGRLAELRELLFHARWTSALFDTVRWVRDLEDAYEEAWRRWVAGTGGDIWLNQIEARGRP